MAKKPVKLITVYAPDGTPEKHSVPNARDLVYGAGYSFHPNRETLPTDHTPIKPVVATTQNATQEVLDKATGGPATRNLDSARAAVPVEEEEPEEEVETEETPNEVWRDPDATLEQVTAPRTRRGRPPRGSN